MRVEQQTEKGLEGPHRPASSSAATRRVVGRFEVDAAGLGYVVPFDRRVVTDIQVPTGQSSSAEPGDMVRGRDHALADRHARPRRHASVEVLGRIDEPGVDTQIIIRKFGIPDAHSRGASPRRSAIGGAVKEQRHQAGAPTSAA